MRRERGGGEKVQLKSRKGIKKAKKRGDLEKRRIEREREWESDAILHHPLCVCVCVFQRWRICSVRGY
jgi:hypothetical protein